MNKLAKKPFTLGDLVRVDAELTIRWDLELPQNADVYRGITPDYSQEIDFDSARAYLLKKEHPANEIERALEPYFEIREKQAAFANNGISLDSALGILRRQKTLFDRIEEEKLKERQKRAEANFIYRDIERTRNFLLESLRGTGIELKFKSLIFKEEGIGKDVADIIIRGWKYFVAVHVSIQDNPKSKGYCMGFAPWHVQIKNLILGEADPLYPFNKDRGSWLLPAHAEMEGHIRISSSFIYSCFDSPYYSKVFDHLVALKADTEDAIKKSAAEAESECLRIEAERPLPLARLLNSK